MQKVELLNVPLGEFVEEDIGRAEESDLGSGRPSLNEVACDITTAKVLDLTEH